MYDIDMNKAMRLEATCPYCSNFNKLYIEGPD